MRKRTLIIGALALAIATVFFATRWMRPVHAAEGRSQAFIGLCDTNGDGRLTLDEFPFGEDLFDAVDTNHDGTITAEEIASLARHQGGHRKAAAEINAVFKKLDKDGDGRISRAECPAEDVEKFQALDADHDGYVTRAEAGRAAGGEAGRRIRKEAEAKEKFRALDRDGDGVLSRDEVPAEAVAFFPILDDDGDGVLALEEVLDAQRSGLLDKLNGVAHRFKEADADADGCVTREEFPTDADVTFEEVDRDGDGKITLDEVVACLGERLGGKMKTFMQRYDRDGDGQVTREEFRGKDEAFDRLDKNSDGVVTADEVGETAAAPGAAPVPEQRARPAGAGRGKKR